MDNFILCGMQFGDEGKGTFTDYLAFKTKADKIVRYNGGSQASHTVITPNNTLHKFSQLSSGSFYEKSHTYLTQNMVINISNLIEEMIQFSEKANIPITELVTRIHIDDRCYVVTEYHKLVNKLREIANINKRRGSVGTGVSEVNYIRKNYKKKFPYEPELALTIGQIFDSYSNNSLIGRLKALYEYTENFYIMNRDAIEFNMPDEFKRYIYNQIDMLLSKNAYMSLAREYIDLALWLRTKLNFHECLYSTNNLNFDEKSTTIFEGAQGLLIDKDYGIKPNTTYLDTTNHYAVKMLRKNDKMVKIGIAKAILSRHGLGVFPTESEDLSSKISDDNQENTFWNGKIRFGWFDAILFKYAQKVNEVDEVYLSCLDLLDDFEFVKVCNEYIYNGKIDERFKKLFSYYIQGGLIFITDIKCKAYDLGKYLERCFPRYISMRGWKKDITEVRNKLDLPKECIDYINLLENLIKVKITLVSVGPTRLNKIQLN